MVSQTNVVLKTQAPKVPRVFRNLKECIKELRTTTNLDTNNYNILPRKLQIQ